MVEMHRPEHGSAVVVKRGRAALRTSAHRAHCVICGAVLARDRGVGDMACSCHQRNVYNPRHDPDLDCRVLTMLVTADPCPVNILRALNTQDRWAIRDAVNRWRARGFPILGVPHVGYRLGGFATVSIKKGRR